MSQALRQSELFAGGDWLVLYRAFTEVNLNAFDFDSIRSSMTDYIRQNYPEDFNDWIESSEFVAILDLLAYLGQSLAFRMDINARENFMDIARRRESILRLARFLSYSPKRNYPARGLVKLTEIKTSNDVYDSAGRNLNNTIVRWNDANNPDWFEQWILVLNDALIPTNPFGTPLKVESIDGIITQLYRLNNIPVSAGNFPFSTYVNNQSMDFDIVNPDFTTRSGFFEKSPSPRAASHLIYRSDGNGNASRDTGFFLMFKQGTLQYSDFTISEPQENRSINVAVANINESDVWVQTVNDSGNVVVNGDWTRVGSAIPSDNATKLVLSTDNITYNNISPDIQNIFQVITQENDQIAIRFGDGRFGEIPVGNLRVWYRISTNQTYSIRPDDMQNLQINVPYTSHINTQKRISLTFSLQETVGNASMTETNDDIRRRAALVSSTQGRMVSGQDYNSLPISTNLATKIKAVNRVYSGQSRYIDLNDPTGTYQDTNVFSDDGCVYVQPSNTYYEIPLSTNPTPSDIAANYILPMVAGPEIRDFLIDEWRQGTDISASYIFDYDTPELSWSPGPTGVDASDNGIFLDGSTPVKLGLAAIDPDSPVRFMTKDSMIKFQSAGWVTLSKIDGDGDEFKTNGEGQVRVNELVDEDDMVIKVLPSYATNLDSESYNGLLSNLGLKRTFGMGYDFETQSWYYIEPSVLNALGDYDFDTKASSFDSSWLIKCEYSPLNWRITSRGLQYVFESQRRCKFFFVNEYRGVNAETGKVSADIVKVLKANDLTSDITFNLAKTFNYGDGYIEPRRVQVSFYDSDADGQADNPESFSDIVDADSLVFHERFTDTAGYEYYRLLDIASNYIWEMGDTAPRLPTGTIGYVIPASGSNLKGTFYIGTSTANSLITDPDAFKVNWGRKNLFFQWKHFATSEHRIDPAVTNVIDVFVLGREYNDSMISWRAAGSNPLTIPVAPSERQLRLSYNELEEFKMFSDEMVWRPAKFKLLFGQAARPELRAKFKVVKLAGTITSDGEIKSRVIEAINRHFNVNKWDFGETFFFTELAGYIHRQLSDAISSVTLVPTNESESFGTLFEIRSQPDEIFFSTAQVSDIEIIPANTQTSLRIR